MLVWRPGSLKMFTFLGCKMADAWDCPVRTKNLSTKKVKNKFQYAGVAEWQTHGT